MSQALHIVIVVDHASITGGQAKVALESAIGLKQAGHEPIVFAAAGPVDPRLIEAGVEFVCLGQSDLVGNASVAAGAAQGIWNFTAAARVESCWRACRASGPSFTSTAGPRRCRADFAPAIRAAGVPAAYTFHEYYLFCPNGGFYDYHKSCVCKLEPR